MLFVVLPSFAIVGTQKGGTTSLMRFLTRHPQVARSERKEVHFFDRFYDRGVDWYSDQFAWRRVRPWPATRLRCTCTTRLYATA